MSFVFNLAFWMYVAAWLPFALFVAFYASRSPWRQSATGRGLMAVSASITAVLSFVLLILIFPDMSERLRDTMRAVLMGGVTISGFLQLKNLLTLQRQRRTEPPSHPLRRATD